MEKENVAQNKSFVFAIEVIEACRCLQDEKREFILSQQLMRSGTAIGALLREAVYAESKADFIHMHAIARKEANETLYWLELLGSTGLSEIQRSDILHQQAVEILKVITSFILTTKQRYLNK